MFGQWDISVVEVVVMVGFGLRGWGWASDREKVVAGIDGVLSDHQDEIEVVEKAEDGQKEAERK